MDKPLPSSAESERCIVGGILTDNRLMAEAAESLHPEDFYSPLHRRVFTAMLELFTAQKPIDPVMIGEILKREGDSGGNLADLAFGLPVFSDLSEYIETVRQKKRLRELARSCSQISAAISAGDEEPATILNRAQTTINAVCTDGEKNGFTTIGEISFAQADKTARLRSGELQASGLKAGLTKLDHITSGFQPADLIVIGGRPSMGKSSLAGQIAMNICRIDRDAVITIFSLEMSKEQYVQRLICSIAEVDIMKLRSGVVSDDELERVRRASIALNEMHIEIDDASTVNAVQMRSKLLQLRHRRGRLDAVVVDFLQRMNTARKTESRQQEVSRIAQDLKSLAKDLDIPVIALSSLSRLCESRNPPRPRMSDLRESGDIESEADLVAFLYRPNYYDHSADPVLAELIIEKHRNGATATVDLHFLREYTRFTDYE